MAKQEKLTVDHRVLIEQDEIELDELPQDIQDSITEYDEMFDDFEKDPDEEKRVPLVQKDLDIADRIITWQEEQDDDNDDDDAELEETLKGKDNNDAAAKAAADKAAADAKVAADKAAADKSAADKAAADKAVADAKAAEEKAIADKAAADKAAADKAAADEAARLAAITPEQKLETSIRAKISNNRISRNDLRDLIGSKPNEYSIGSLSLRMKAFSDDYEVVS